jgi:hypothetical protein
MAEKTFTGKSKNGSLSEAVDKAIASVRAYAEKSPDAEISAHLSSISYTTGGLAGQNNALKVEFVLDSANQRFSLQLQPRGRKEPKLKGGNGTATGRSQ